MATLGANNLTLADWAKLLDPDGTIGNIIPLLAKQTPLLEDLTFIEGNLPTGHRVNVETALPSPTWRRLNQGVAPSKGKTEQFDEQCGMLADLATTDVKLAGLGGNPAAVRAKSSMMHMRGMMHEAEATFFYGNHGLNSEEFDGLANRYNSLSGTNGQNIINAAGAGADNSSIWLLGFGDECISGIFPQGSTAGLKHEDMGVQLIADSTGIAGSQIKAYVDSWEWDLGLAVMDWRFAVRIANIDISNLVGESSAADLIKLMIKATHRIPNLQACTPKFYMNRSCFQMLDIQRYNNVKGAGLEYKEVDGKVIYSFRGIEIRVSDSLLETESVVS